MSVGFRGRRKSRQQRESSYITHHNLTLPPAPLHHLRTIHLPSRSRKKPTRSPSHPHSSYPVSQHQVGNFCTALFPAANCLGTAEGTAAVSGSSRRPLPRAQFYLRSREASIASPARFRPHPQISLHPLLPATQWALPMPSRDHRGTFVFPYIGGGWTDSSSQKETRRFCRMQIQRKFNAGVGRCHPKPPIQKTLSFCALKGEDHPHQTSSAALSSRFSRGHKTITVMNGTLNCLREHTLYDEGSFMFTSESVGEGHPGKDLALETAANSEGGPVAGEACRVCYPFNLYFPYSLLIFTTTPIAEQCREASHSWRHGMSHHGHQPQYLFMISAYFLQ